MGAEESDGVLAAHPCRSLCRWVRTRGPLFACRGCGSQWRPGEAWTPADADGTVPAAVRRAAREHAALTSGRRAGGAGSGGT